jgi:hypothetical protein
MTEPAFTINNGRRTGVEFGAYKGRAGISQDGSEVAFMFDGNVARLVGKTGTIDGARYRVESARLSERPKGMVVLTVTAVTAEG